MLGIAIYTGSFCGYVCCDDGNADTNHVWHAKNQKINAFDLFDFNILGFSQSNYNIAISIN